MNPCERALEMVETRHSEKALISNRKGLHARAAVKFAQLAADYQAQITVSKDGMTVLATSIMGLMMLAAPMGTYIDIEAFGDDAIDAVDALVELVEMKFNEE